MSFYGWTMGARFVGWRNALIASPAFQRWAARFPLTRPIARRRAAALFDLVAGFTYSQTLFACVELGLFGRLAIAPATPEALAGAAGVPARSLALLVDAAAALDLLQRLPDDRIALGAAGAALVGNPGAMAMIAHHRHLYGDLADPVALLRARGGGALASYWSYARGDDPAAVADYSRLMGASVAPVADELLRADDLGRHRRLLDVGGGEGRFLAEVRARLPGLTTGLFDLPAVVARARDRLGPAVACHAGDFRHDPLPGGYDCITLVRILHDHDDAVAAALLAATRTALPPGGTLLIVEPMAEARGAARVGAAYFGWYLQAMGSGRPRRAAEYGDMLRRAGFSHWRELPTVLPLVTSIVRAEA